MHAGRGQLQHPVDICRRDEMPVGRITCVRRIRPSANARSISASVVPGGIRRASAPPGGWILLRLHGTEPGDDIGRLTVNCPRDALVVESLFGDCDVHRAGGEECVARRITFQI